VTLATRALERTLPPELLEDENARQALFAPA
jgi:hypothetical protein